MLIQTCAKVYYNCYLNKEDENKVIEYSKENGLTLEDAAWELWEKGELDFYSETTTESECNTESVEFVRLEEE